MEEKKQKRMSLDELFTTQQTTVYQCTIEPDEKNLKNVIITPWYAGDGCQCENSISLNRDTIDYVESTGNVHFCCGKRLQVVEVHFKKGASIPVENVISRNYNYEMKDKVQWPQAPPPPGKICGPCVNNKRTCLIYTGSGFKQITETCISPPPPPPPPVVPDWFADWLRDWLAKNPI